MEGAGMNHSEQTGPAREMTLCGVRRWIVWAARMAGIAFGLATHLLFAVTVYQLFFFLRDGIAPVAQLLSLRFEHSGSLLKTAVDVLLVLQYALIHSLLLYPAVRRRLNGIISSAFYGCFFCSMTCLTLLLTMVCWQPTGRVLYEFTGTPATVVLAGFLMSWAALFYSLALSGLGYQTGWTPWWAWVRGLRLPRRQFEERGAYRLFRHPIYLSFLGLIWFTSRMTLDHAVLTGVWTVYIFAGSWLKDERLAFYAGPPYREYQSRVPGYPFLLRGPLGLRPVDAVSRSAIADDGAETRPGYRSARKAA